MPYTYTNKKGEVYALYREDTKLPDGRIRSGYFFSQDTCCANGELPKGYTVTEDQAGTPVLKKV